MFTAFPSGFQFGRTDVPVRTAFLQHRAQVLPKLFDGRSAKNPVAVVDRKVSDVCPCDRSAHNREILRQLQCLLSYGSASSKTMRRISFLSATRLGGELHTGHRWPCHFSAANPAVAHINGMRRNPMQQ